jgi:hypothetical protein
MLCGLFKNIILNRFGSVRFGSVLELSVPVRFGLTHPKNPPVSVRFGFRVFSVGSV